MKTKTQLAALAAVTHPNFRTCLCVFEDTGKHYTYLLHASMASRVQVGDLVLVTDASFAANHTAPKQGNPFVAKSGKVGGSGGWGLRVARVVEVHQDAQIDDDTLTYQYVASKVDTVHAVAVKEMHDELVQRLANAQRRNAQEQAVRAMGLSNADLQAFGLLQAPMGQSGNTFDDVTEPFRRSIDKADGC